MTRPRLRTGLAVLTVVGVLAVLAVGVPEWSDRWSRWHDRDSLTAVAPALETADGALRAEAQASVRYLVGGEAGDRAALAETRITADRTVRALRDRASDAPPGVRAAVAGLVADWSRWRGARVGIDRRTIADDRALAELAVLTGAAADVADAIASVPQTTADDRRAIAQLTRARAALAGQQRDLTVALTRVALSPAELASLRAVPGTLAVTLEPARRHLRAAGVDFRAFDRAHARTLLLARIAREGTVPFWTVADWERRAAAEITQLDGTIRRALVITSAAEDAAKAAAWDSLRNWTLLIAGAVLALVAAGVVLVRRVRRPVRALTRAVVHAAEGRAAAGPNETPGEIVIPPVARQAAGDVGELAAAIAQLDRATLPLAAGRAPATDADLVVKLARRNQPLLSRQIALIDDLEAREQDPERLQSLFQLDQLATRMRRNGESLLVLAGMEPDRRPTTAMPLADVVRDAVSEIAHFARIDVVGLPTDVAVTGGAARDLVHALAELLENAATFSKPDTRVFVRGRRRGEGLELIVADEGIGIPVTRLDAYNELLAHPPMPGLDLSRALGLVVVARLCERIGATVTLRSAPDVGTSAVIVLTERVLEPVVGDGPAPVAPESAAALEVVDVVDADTDRLEPAAEIAPAREVADVVEVVGAEPTLRLVTAAEGAPPDEDADAGEREIAVGQEDDDELSWPAPIAPSAPAASAAPTEGVHFTAVPVARPGNLLPDGILRPPRRRARHGPSTGTLHRAPSVRRGEPSPMGGNE